MSSPLIGSTGDATAAVFAAAQHLLQLNHERIGVMVPTLELGTMRDRVSGHHRPTNLCGEHVAALVSLMCIERKVSKKDPLL